MENKKIGVRVETEDGRIGYIVRRLNAEAYEISILEEVVVLSPNEFKEINDEN